MRISDPLVRFVFTAFLGGLGLLGFANALQRRVDRGSKSEGRITRMVNVKSELRSIFAPQALIDFAKKHPAIEDYDQLVLLLEAEGLSGSWYVIVATDVLSDGESRRNVCYVYPSRMPYRFPSSRMVLDILRGDFPAGTRVGGEKARIMVIPDTLAVQDPAAIVSDLTESAR